MAAKNMVWNIDVEGIPYKIEFAKNEIVINNGTPIKLKQLKKLKSSAVETNYELPIENADVILHDRMPEAVLTYRNRDCATGEEYIPMNIPGWVWVFVVLHILNFFLLLGGAVGGAIQGMVIYLMLSVSANTKKETGVRVLSCAGIWLLSTIIQFLLVAMIFSAV